ncbi:MAG: helix-turn-helix domain-containing protein [Staphylococcus equorum]
MIGEKIKKLRIEKNISQTELANILFVSRQTIGRWEREQTIPNTENIVMLANFFEVETSAFFDTYNDNKNTLVGKRSSFKQFKGIMSTYKLDLYIFFLLIIPFFYILLKDNRRISCEISQIRNIEFMNMEDWYLKI